MEWTEELLDKLKNIFHKKWEDLGSGFRFKNQDKDWCKFCSKHKIIQISSESGNDAWMHWFNIASRDHVIVTNPNCERSGRSDFIAVPMDFAEKCLVLGVI